MRMKLTWRITRATGFCAGCALHSHFYFFSSFFFFLLKLLWKDGGFESGKFGAWQAAGPSAGALQFISGPWLHNLSTWNNSPHALAANADGAAITATALQVPVLFRFVICPCSFSSPSSSSYSVLFLRRCASGRAERTGSACATRRTVTATHGRWAAKRLCASAWTRPAKQTRRARR